MEHQLPGMSGACLLLHLCLCFSLSLQSNTILNRCAQFCVECTWYKFVLVPYLAADVHDGAFVPLHEARLTSSSYIVRLHCGKCI